MGDSSDELPLLTCISDAVLLLADSTLRHKLISFVPDAVIGVPMCCCFENVTGLGSAGEEHLSSFQSS